MLATAAWAILALGILSARSGAEPIGTAPALNGENKWRIAYYEGGVWADYHETLKVVVEGLMALGWMETAPIPEFSAPGDNRPLWQWLAASAKSDYLQFVGDGFWSSGWDVDQRGKNREACIERLRRGDFDLIIAMGTWAGKDLANNRHSVPTFVMSVTDPVASGIVRSAEDSGLDHVIAKCEPNRYIRQIHLCYDIFQFGVVGVVYDANDPEGRVLGHVDRLHQVGADRGFQVAECHAPDLNTPLEAVVRAYRKCVETLAPEIDILYLSHHRGTDPRYLYDTLKPLYAQGVPAWSARGSLLVKAGAVMSIAREDFSFLAPFYSETIAKILNGATPRKLDQRVKERLQLAVNLEAARLTGYKVPGNVLKVASVVFHSIETPPGPDGN